MNARSRLHIVLSLIGFLAGLAAQAQTSGHVTKTETVYDYFKATYEVLASDTSVCDGAYELAYGTRTLEKGQYSKGNKTGEWEYRNLQNMVELRYNWTTKRPTYMLPHKGYTYNQKNYPATFLGSSMIPFYYVHSKAYYPKAEANNKSGGYVTLSLRISPTGRLSSFAIKDSSSPNFARVVRKAAEQIPKGAWRWVPALKNGVNVDGYYDITIMFEN